jgi:DNA transformation protein
MRRKMRPGQRTESAASAAALWDNITYDRPHLSAARATGSAAQRRRRLDAEFIHELFAPFGPVTVKRMFGGAGIWSDGLMFGLEFDGAIFLRVDEDSIPDFAREGSKPFVYPRAKSPKKIGRASKSFWRLPERLYDDPDELAEWARRAFAVAERKKFAARKQTRTRRAGVT